MSFKKKIDFSNIPENESTFVLVDEGIYEAFIFNVEEGEPSSNGNEVLIFSYSIADGKFMGEKIKDYMYFSEKAMFRVKALLKALGLNTTGDVEVDFLQLIGKNLKIEISHKLATQGKHKGKTFANVANFLESNKKNKESNDGFIEVDDDDIPF